MSDYVGSLLQLSLLQEVALTELRTLAVEFSEKQITADRFSTRAVTILCEMQKDIKELKLDFDIKGKT